MPGWDLKTFHSKEMEKGEDLLTLVESVLLPKNLLHHNVPENEELEKKNDFQSTPHKRFLDLVYELAVADHVRAMQAIYRDSYDEQYLYQEIRSENRSLGQFRTKELMERIIVGRSRLIALARLCYGNHHLTTFRSRLDLSVSYAYHGLWAQSHEKCSTLFEDIKRWMNDPSTANDQSMSPFDFETGFDCAMRVLKVYRCIRRHAHANAGKIFPTVITSIVSELDAEMSKTDSEKVPHPSRLAASLHNFFSATSKVPLKKFAASYFTEENGGTGSANNATTRNETLFKSWGDVIDYLRNKCEVMQIWVENAESTLLPQSKAILTTPFRFCDPSHRNLAHCIQLSSEIVKFPSAFKLISGSSFLKKLAEMNLAIPVDETLLKKTTGVKQNNSPETEQAPLPQKTILYELPITFEEYISLYLLECKNYVTQQQEYLIIQTMTICGICSSYLNQLEAAESIFTDALHRLESIGLDMELCACELFNAIAQMMMNKYTRWFNQKKEKLKSEIEDWMTNTEEGKKAVRIQIRNFKKQFNFHSRIIPLPELTHQAKQIVYKIKVKEYFQQEEESFEMKKLLDVSSRYLIRSFDILESYHNNQAITGTACLAIASVQNLLKDYEECREWLLRGLRIFEKCSPLPIRAISFTQIQLANVLKKLSHDDEACRVLMKALEFHRSQARVGLLEHAYLPITENIATTASLLPTTSSLLHRAESLNHQPSQQQPHPINLFPLILKNTALSDDIDTSMKLSREVIELSIKCGNKWEATLHAEDLSKLVESAFGWDSAEAAETYKEV